MRKQLLLIALLLFTASAAAQTKPQPGVVLERGQLQLRRGPGLVLTLMRVRLRLAGGAAVSCELEAAGQDAGSDAAGDFERQRFRLKPNGDARGVKSAALEVRRYQKSGVLVAWLDYDGPALAPREGVQLVSSLDRFARGMATKRFKIYWTAPVFFSDYRFLGPANQLMLWKQTEGADYHLLVPLAGGGMLGEVGVSEIEWRPEFRVAASSYDPDLAPRRFPLFAYAAGADPYRLPRELYETAFAATAQYGRLRWQKGYPEVFTRLGWCSWNAYGQAVTADKIVESIRSIRAKQIPLGFVLVDDGWLSVRDQKLTAFDADEAKFPGGMTALARRLREEYRVPHVGVWHTFQGYWNGVADGSEVAREHRMFKGLEGKLLPDPREGRGESFYVDWYGKLKGWGYDFVKVDGQGNNVKFTDSLLPLFDTGAGAQRNLQEAAAKVFDDGQGPGLINCMEMTLENVYNWGTSNVARSSDDYQPELKHNPKDHVFQNAYNVYWLANFAYPDWDMFQSHDPAAAYHAAARALSGGPVYFTDEAGKERPEILKRLALSDGRLLRPDEPAQVTRDLLLNDPSIESTPLKVFARVSRPGLTAGVVAAFNVNKTADRLAGTLDIRDPEWPGGDAPARVAVYRPSDESVKLLEAHSDVENSNMVFVMRDADYDLFTLAPAEGGIAVFGLLDKYLSPAAVVSVTRVGGGATVRLAEAGDFGAWLARRPARVEVDGRALPPSSYTYAGGLLRVPRASFGERAGEREIRIILGRR